MQSTFIGSAPANFQPGRPAGLTPAAIVLHRTGSRETLKARFNDSRALVSAHYVVCRDGRVEQYVLESDTAFHAGMIVSPTWTLLRRGVNPNFYTLGVELEGERTADWPDAQVEAAAALIGGLARRWSIALDAEHVVAHSRIRASSDCPAQSCPIARMLQLAGDAATVTRTPQQRLVRTTSAANLRDGAPTLQARIARVLPAGMDVTVTTFVDNGEPVQGNPAWYGDESGLFLWAGATDVPRPAPAAESSPSPIDVTTDSMDLTTTSAPSGTIAGVRVDATRMRLAAKEFFAEEPPKDLIVLHFTAGRSAQSAFDTWRNDPRHIATAYIVDLDGTIYEAFPPSCWASHLGVPGTNGVHDRRSIGIEIANVGPLQIDADDPSSLNWWPKKSATAADFTTKFCAVAETDRYVATSYRGKSHFAAFPEPQVDAVSSLVRSLCARFGIKMALPAASRRFECDATAFAGYRGVCTHANFRKDKWDIGPAFPWDRLGL